MDELRISDAEIKCIQILAQQFENGGNYLTNPRDVLTQGGMDWNGGVTFNGLLGMMERYGVIDKIEHSDQVLYLAFGITGRAVELARQIELAWKQAQEPRDIVEQLTIGAKKRPIIAWMIIAFFVLTAAATLINQTIQIFQNLGWIPKP